MQCGHCGTENPENAVYCKHCGKRLDGMRVCNFCGKLTPEDGEFCINCGADKNAPAYSKNSRFISEDDASDGVVREEGEKNMALVRSAGAEKASDGGAVYAGAIIQPELRTNTKAAGGSKKTSDILNIIAFSFAAFAALLGFAFVFAIGNKPYVFGSGDSADLGSGSFIYYFFGEAYRESLSLAERNLTGPVSGTVFAALGIAGTVACFVLSLIRFIRILTKKTQKGMLMPAAATVVVYICAVAFYFLNVAQSIDTTDLYGYIGLNAATISGVVLSSAFIVSAAVLSAIARGAVCGLKTYLFNSLFKGGYAVLLFVAIGLTSFGLVFFGSGSYGSNAGFGILTLFSTISLPLGTTDPYLDAAYTKCVALTIVIVVAAVVLGVSAVFTVSEYASAIPDKPSRKMLPLMIASSVCPMVIGAMMLGTSVVFIDGYMYSNSVNVAVPVVLMVLGVLMLAISIVYTVLSKKFNANHTVAD